jgi:thioesterase domain-containing protein
VRQIVFVKNENYSEMQMHDAELNYLKVVALGGSGGQTPLFCLPGAGGEVTTFRDMASLIADGQSVYGIDMQGFFAADREFTVEQLAGFCLSAIRERQARGPYHMCGYSFGAIIAYEVASRLRRDGEDVGLLALIDTGNPAFRAQLSSPGTKQLQKRYVANRLAKYFRFLADGNIRAFAGSLSSLFAACAGIKTRRLIRSVCRAMNRPMPDVFRNNDRALFVAWRAYNPPASALSLLLFYGAHRRAEHGGDPALGWSLCASGQVDVELTLEGHVEMMKIPHVRSFATRLNRHLNGRAQ